MDDLYLELFTRTMEQTAAYHKSLDGIKLQRVRTTHAGGVLMVEAYPVYYSEGKRFAMELARQRRLKKEYSPAQRLVDANRARRRLSALANENFGPGDILMTLTWRADDPERPASAEAAKKEVDRYLRRVKRLRDKRGLEHIRYIYVIETTDGPKHGEQHHAHLLTGGDGVTEWELRGMWRSMHKDARVQTDSVWDRPEGLTRWAGYVTKGEQKDADGRQKVKTQKRWYASRGLRRPKVTVADKKISKARAEKIARDFEGDGRKILEKLHKGYKVLDLEVRTSEWMPGVYIYATLGRDGEDRRKTRWDE